MAYVYFALICLLFGSNFVLMHRAAAWFGPIEVGLGRLIGSTLFIGVLWLVWERDQRFRWRDLPGALLVGLVANAYPYVAQPALIGQGFGHSFFGMTVSLAPLLTILVSIPLLGVRPSARQLVGVLAGLGFVALLMFDGNARGITPGMLAVAASIPLGYAVGNTWLRKTLTDAAPTPLSLVMSVSAALMLLPLFALPALQEAVGVTPPPSRIHFGVAAASLAFLGTMGTGACMWMFVRLVQREGPLFAGMVTYVVPVVAMLWGLADRETITPRQVVAIAGVLAMVALVQVPGRRAVATPDGEALDASPVESTEGVA